MNEDYMCMCVCVCVCDNTKEEKEHNDTLLQWSASICLSCFYFSQTHWGETDCNYPLLCPVHFATIEVPASATQVWGLHWRRKCHYSGKMLNWQSAFAHNYSRSWQTDKPLGLVIFQDLLPLQPESTLRWVIDGCFSHQTLLLAKENKGDPPIVACIKTVKTGPLPGLAIEVE